VASGHSKPSCRFQSHVSALDPLIYNLQPVSFLSRRFDRIVSRLSRAVSAGGASEGGVGCSDSSQRSQSGIAEFEDNFSQLEFNLKQDLPRILPYLNVTAEHHGMRGALYEPVCNLMKIFHAYRPDMLFDQASL
jgi:hypothetical protein